MVQQNTDFGRVADDLRRAATAFALLTSQATLLGAALSSFREFERQLALTGAIARANAAEFRQLTNAARDFALVTTTTAVQAGQALQNLAQAGFDAEQSVAGLAGVLLLAQATATDVGTSADVLSSNIRAFNLETSDATRVSNLFVAAQNNSLATIEKLTFALRQVGPVAEVAGLNIEETTAFLGQLFNIGLRGEQAGTSLRNVIVRLIRPVGEAREILQDLGIATVDATGNFRGLEKVLQDIAAAGLGEAQLARIFEQEALAGAIALLNSVQESADGTASSYQDLLASISGTNTALVQALKQLDTLDGSLKLLRNSLTDLGITVGEQLAPFLRSVSLTVRDLLEAFRELDPETQQQIGAWAGLAAASLGVLAATNALILLLRPLFVTILPSLATAIGVVSSALLFQEATLYRLGIAWGRFTAATSLGAVLAAVGSLAVALGPLVVAAAAVGGAFLLLRNQATESLDEIAERARRAAVIDIDLEVNIDKLPDFVRGATIAQQVIDLVGTDVAIQEARNRIRLANDLINGDLINLLTEGDLRQGISAARSAQSLTLEFAETPIELIGEFVDELVRRTEGEAGDIAEQIKNVTAINDAIAVQVQRFVEEDIEAPSFLQQLLGVPDPNVARRLEAASTKASLEFQLDNFFSSITADRKAILSRAIEQIEGLTEEQKNLIKQYEDARQAESQVLARFFRQISEDARGTVSGAFAPFAELLQNLDRTQAASAELIQELKDALLETEDLITPAEFARITEVIEGGSVAKVLAEIANLLDLDETNQLRLALEEAERQGNLDNDAVAQIAELLVANERQFVTKLFGSLEDAIEGVKADVEKGRARIAERQAGLTDDLAEAIRLLTQAGTFNLEADLTAIQRSFIKDFEEVFGQIDLRKGVAQALEAAFQGLSDLDLGEDAPSFADVASGKFLIDAIKEQVDENSTPEEIAAIAAAEAEKTAQLFEAYIEVIASVLKLPQARIDELRELAGLQVERVQQAILEGVLDTDLDIERATKRITNAARSAASRIPDDVKALREYEDQIDDLRDAARDAARSFAELAPNLDIGVRSELFRQLDIADIVQDYEEQVRKLRRAQEDLARNQNIEDSQRDELNAQYEQTIEIIELAKQAEIDATNSFVQQMERRSEAIDAYIDDLRNRAASGEITDAFAGFSIAIAEFSRDLITVTDIWAEAVLDGLNSISGTLADTIFEGENLLEGLKETALRISRQVFENFTNAFLQNIVENLTKGDGPLAEAIRTGLGGIGQAEVPSIVNEVLRVQTELTGLATTVQTNGANVTNALNTTGTGVQTSGQQLVSAITSVAAAVQSTIASIGSMIPAGLPTAIGVGVGTGLNPAAPLTFGTTIEAATASVKNLETALAGFVKNFGPRRPGDAGPEITNIVRQAAFDVFGEGTVIIGKSGTGEHGSVRHRASASGTGVGHALDFSVQLPNGTLLDLSDPRALDFAKRAGQLGATGFGAGTEYMGSNTFHLDNFPLEQYTSQMDQAWGSWGNANQAALEASTRLQNLGMEASEAGTSLNNFGPTVLEGVARNMPTPEQFVSLFENAFSKLPFSDALNFSTDSLRDGAQAGDVLSAAFDPGMLTGASTAQLHSTIAQLNAVLQAAGTQLGVSLQQVATGTQTGGQQVQLALTQVGTQTRSGGTQVNSSLQTTASGVTTSGGQLTGAIQGAAQGIRAASAQLSVGQRLGNAFTSPSFLTGLLGYIPLLFKDGGEVDISKAMAFAGGGEVMPQNVYNFVRNFNQGGDVMGPGTGTSDDILAWLSNGEFVVNAKDTNRNRELLDAINNGADDDQLARIIAGRSLPEFAQGGLVGGGFGETDGSILGNFKDFGYLGSKVDPVAPNQNAGNTQNVQFSPTYNINISGGDQQSADRFQRSANQHAKDLGAFIQRAKRNS